jgi:hypothetical protein
MMREVTGAFFGARRLDEALEDLRAEGITGDRVRIADAGGGTALHACLERSASSPTQWITAAYPECAECAECADDIEYAMQEEAASPGVDASDDDILPYRNHAAFHADDDTAFHGLTRVMVSIRDDAELRAVCDIFSRLGTDDIDAETTLA